MRVGETLDAAINLYRLHWKTLMALVAFVIVPFVFLQSILSTLFVGGDVLGTNPFGLGEPPSNARIAGFAGVTIAFAALNFLLIQPFLTAAMVRAVATSYLGGIPAVADAYAFALRRIGSIIWVLVLVVLAIGAVFVAAGGFIALFAVIGAAPLAIPVIIAALVLAAMMYVRWLFGPSVLVIESRRGTAALRRSWQLSSRAFWKIVGTTILAGILTALVGGIFAIVPTLLSVPLGSAGWVLRAAGSAVGSVVTTPFATMVTVLLYFDQRIRKEGMDLTIMAGELESVPGR